MTGTPDPLLDEVESLLRAPAGRDDPARLERVLTDGYARALMLEVKRSRLQKSIDRLAADEGASEDLATLVRELGSKDEELVTLAGLARAPARPLLDGPPPRGPRCSLRRFLRGRRRPRPGCGSRSAASSGCSRCGS